MVAAIGKTTDLSRRSPDVHQDVAGHVTAKSQRDEAGWPRFVGDFVTSDPALQDCIIRAMAMSGFLDVAETAYRGGATRDQVRALLLRAVLEGMQW